MVKKISDLISKYEKQPSSVSKLQLLDSISKTMLQSQKDHIILQKDGKKYSITLYQNTIEYFNVKRLLRKFSKDIHEVTFHNIEFVSRRKLKLLSEKGVRFPKGEENVHWKIHQGIPSLEISIEQLEHHIQETRSIIEFDTESSDHNENALNNVNSIMPSHQERELKKSDSNSNICSVCLKEYESQELTIISKGFRRCQHCQKIYEGSKKTEMDGYCRECGKSLNLVGVSPYNSSFCKDCFIPKAGNTLNTDGMGGSREAHYYNLGRNKSNSQF